MKISQLCSWCTPKPTIRDLLRRLRTLEVHGNDKREVHGNEKRLKTFSEYAMTERYLNKHYSNKNKPWSHFTYDY